MSVTFRKKRVARESTYNLLRHILEKGKKRGHVEFRGASPSASSRMRKKEEVSDRLQSRIAISAIGGGKKRGRQPTPKEKKGVSAQAGGTPAMGFEKERKSASSKFQTRPRIRRK